MNTYPFKELMELWITNRITAEQAIGHLMQHINQMREQDQQQLQRIRLLEQNVLELRERLDPPDAAAGKPVKR